MILARNRLRPSPRLPRAGYSLVELVIAMLISCLMITAVMGVAVTARRGGVKGMHRLMFNQGISQLSAQVKQYVTACGCNPSTGACDPTGCAVPGNLGPHTANSGFATWYLTGGGLADAATAGGAGRGVYALMCGPHYVTGVVPSLEGAPYNGYIQYDVSWPGGCPTSIGATDTPVVTFTAQWDEPP